MRPDAVTHVFMSSTCARPRTGGAVAQLNVSQRIIDIVGGWDGVTVQPHRSGGVVFRVHQREIGHLHDRRTADLRFPLRERRDLVASGRARPHHMLAASGWVSHPIRSEHDIPAVIDLMRRNYERLRGIGQRSATHPLGEASQFVHDQTGDELPA